MSKVLKIAIISHALALEPNQKRWRKLAEDKRYKVPLIISNY